MIIWISLLVVLMVPSLFLCFEITAAYFYSRRRTDKDNCGLEQGVSYVVIIPAHNEEKGLPQMLAVLLGQVNDPENILVVADNCTDKTAAVAKQFGVMVVERFNEQLKGKGYALDYGIKFFQTKYDPEVFLVFDADCELVQGSIPEIASKAVKLGRPVQATYVCLPKEDAEPRLRIAAFAMLLKNYIRPLGLKMVNQPCLLGGTGMAFPKKVVEQLTFATGNIVEDVQLGIESVRIGCGPYFYEDALVESQFPGEQEAEKTQRTRWEHGHLKTIASEVPPLLLSAVKEKNSNLLFLALEIGVPPLSLLILTQATLSVVCVCAGIVLGKTSLICLGVLPIAVLAAAVVFGWSVFGRELLPPRYFFLLPWYIIKKIPIYIKFLFKPEKNWVRTSRD